MLKRAWLAASFAALAVLFGAFTSGCLSDSYRPDVTLPPSLDAATNPPVNGADGAVPGDDAGAHPGPGVTAFKIGGRVTGLAGKGLVLQNNGGDNLAIKSDGTFTFAKPIAAGSPYFVSVLAQPTDPTQACAVANGGGKASADVTTVVITCETKTYPIGGTASGVAGSGLVLELTVGTKTELFTVAQNGAFTFPTNLPSGAAFTVKVHTNPVSPSQTCTVSGGTGTVVAGAITSIVVNCATNKYVLGGTITGLLGQGLVLANGQTTVAINANGTFAFADPVPSGASYAISVASQPSSPTQTCSIGGGSGIVGGSDVTSIAVTCGTDAFTIGGTVTGLAGTGLVLENNGGDPLAVSADGAFTFSAPIASGAPYAVTVKTQPTSPWQTCTVASGAGIVGGASVANVAITCAANEYAVGGTVSGLAGSGFTLTLNGASTAISADGPFTFASSVASGAPYVVAIGAEPSDPTQTCTIANGQGTIAGAPVTNIAVTCATNTYAVGGSILGLTGSGLALTNNGGDAITIAPGQTTFTFPTPIASGGTYDVAIATQPSSPTQTCSISAGQGTIVAGAITGVVVNCATNAYLVGGTVTGLAGHGLVLANGASTIAVNSNGAFAFAAPVSSGAPYAVTVTAQPTGPTQSCVVTSGTGVVGGANVTSVRVACTTSAFSIGGTVSALAGAGLVLQNNGADPLPITTSGGFTFAAHVASGAPYAVSVRTQPTAPWQTCAVTNGSGTVGGANVTNVAVACVTNRYTIGGTVSGLAGAGLTVTLNGGSVLPVTADGTFAFPSTLASGSPYAVAIASQPTNPSQTCTLANASGTVAGANVANVAITCATNRYTIGGTITGLAGTGLRITNGPDALTIPPGANTFTFPTPVASGLTYNVQIAASPTGPAQTCAVTGGQGTVVGGPITTVAINCSTNAYTVGGTVTGLTGTGLVLRNGAATVAVSGNGSFAFATPIASGTAYSVSVATAPTNPSQTCAITNGAGTVTNANVTTIAVACTTNRYTVGGTVTGLAGTGLVLQNNGTDDLTIAANGAFTFATSIASGANYLVTVKTSPSNRTQSCAITNAGGRVGGGNVTTVQINCTTSTFTIGGTVTGLAGSGLALALNGGSALTVPASGSFTFGTPIASGDPYSVTVEAQPSNPSQTCTIASPSGTVGSTNVSLAVTCSTNAYKISGKVIGLTGTGLTLTNNGTDAITVAPGGTDFSFPTAIASGKPYNVQVSVQPRTPTQLCTVTGGAGTVGSANVVNIVVNCATSTFTVSGTVTGLAGSGLVLNDGTDAITVTGNAFAFPALASGRAYNVTVTTQPRTPWQTCTVTNGSGTITNQNVTNVAIACVKDTFTVSVNVSGLAGGGLRISDAVDTIPIPQSGTYTFPKAIPSGDSYAISFPSMPTSPWQACRVSSGSTQGVIQNANVTVNVTCTTNAYQVAVTVTQDFQSCPLTLKDTHGTLNVTPPVNTTTTYFLPPLASGTQYTMTSSSTSFSCQCAVRNTNLRGNPMTFGSGTITNANPSYAIDCFYVVP